MNRRNWFGRLVSVVAGVVAGKAIASHPSKIVPQLPVHPDVMHDRIQEAIGEASVCWEHIERAGEFQTDAAIQVGERLLKDLGSPFEILARQIRSDDGYAWSWHCNVAVAAMDEGLDHAAANRAAARFMRHFGVDTTKHPAYAD